jgi:hypothetical protein
VPRCLLQYTLYSGVRHIQVNWSNTQPEMCDFGDDSRLYTLSNIPMAASVGNAEACSRTRASRTVGSRGTAIYHSSNHACLSNCFKLSWAVLHIGTLLYTILSPPGQLASVCMTCTKDGCLLTSVKNPVHICSIVLLL